jgi:hypothetical protein
MGSGMIKTGDKITKQMAMPKTEILIKLMNRKRFRIIQLGLKRWGRGKQD